MMICDTYNGISNFQELPLYHDLYNKSRDAGKYRNRDISIFRGEL